MTFEQLMGAVITAIVGGSGIVGLAVHYLKRYIDKRLGAEEAAAAERVELRRRRMTVEDRLQHAYGRMLFWLRQAVIKPPPNGELDAAFKALEDAEEAKKNLDREIIAAYEREVNA